MSYPQFHAMPISSVIDCTAPEKREHMSMHASEMVQWQYYHTVKELESFLWIFSPIDTTHLGSEA